MFDANIWHSTQIGGFSISSMLKTLFWHLIQIWAVFLRSFLACHACVRLSRQPQGRFRCNCLGILCTFWTGLPSGIFECFEVSASCGQCMRLSGHVPKELSGIFCDCESSDMWPWGNIQVRDSESDFSRALFSDLFGPFLIQLVLLPFKQKGGDGGVV